MALNFFKKNILLPAAGLFLPLVISAQGGPGDPANPDGSGDGISTPPPNVKIDEVLERVRNYFLGAVIVACVFVMIYAGFLMVTAGGDENKVASAKKTITYGVIGLIVALLANAIVGLVRSVVGGT